ncbi:hypothetical protein SASPL_111076 [Salvia splendens]|uniref:Uncharacterized protein n=1 Tax=Salvia splendens TaxID=180675 RepID=A0A8X8YBT0_SALSN|nr:hypothetical protein SASPL_111076 [Salvia splendens]
MSVRCSGKGFDSSRQFHGVRSCVCTATKPIILEIQGTLLANTHLSSYSQGAWISIDRVAGLLLTGKSVWKYGTDSDLPLLPVVFFSIWVKSVENAKVDGLKVVNSMGFHLETTVFPLANHVAPVTVSAIKREAERYSLQRHKRHVDFSNINKFELQFASPM